MVVRYGSNAADIVNGGTGGDTLYGWAKANAPGNFGPDSDNDILQGFGGNDLLDGGAGNDELYDYEGRNTLMGGAGDDTLICGEARASLLMGGSGIDLVDIGLISNTAVFVFAGPEVEQVLPGGLRLIGVERISVIGSIFNDSMTGGAWDDTLDGSDGSDYLAGGGGNDLLKGGWLGRDTLLGGTGNDTLTFTEGHGKDLLDGGDGIDLFSYTRTTETGAFRMTLKASMWMADGTHAIGMDRLEYNGSRADEHIIGGAYDDTILGNGGADVLEGWGGNDYLSINFGYSEAATLYGGKGDDTVEGFNPLGAGTQMYGGAGNDLLHASLQNASTAVVLSVVDLAGTYQGPDGIIFAGFERVDLLASMLGDSVTGGVNGDTLLGLDGNDALLGGGGNDSISGDRGRDTVDGGTGDDTLIGWYGGDVMTGGAGADWFGFVNFSGLADADRITDFTVGQDAIILQRYYFGAVTGSPAVTAAEFVQGIQALDADDHILYDRPTGRLWYDADGVGGAGPQLVVTLTAGTALTNADVLLYAYF